jgi:hypothetical protein
VPQGFPVVRDDGVGEAEDDAVHRLGQLVIGGVRAQERDVLPAFAGAQLARLGQHPLGQVHAVDAAARPDRFHERREIPPRPAPDFEDSSAGL